MKLTKQILREMVSKQMKTMTEGLKKPANIERTVSRLISDFKRARGAVQVAMVTAENPPGANEAFDWDNKMMQGYLRMDLNELGYDYFPIIGDYGGLENSLMVVVKEKRAPNFKDHMIRLGKKYLQDAVVIGEKMASSQTNPNIPQAQYNMVFEMVMLNPTKTGQPNMDLGDYGIDDMRTDAKKGPGVQDRQSFFSKAGKKKFIVPFYSSDPSDNPQDMANPFPVGE